MRGFVAASMLYLAVLVSPALAQEDVDESRATSFQAVEGAQREDVPGGPLLIGAYGVTLLLLVGYVARPEGIQILAYAATVIVIVWASAMVRRGHIRAVTPG